MVAEGNQPSTRMLEISMMPILTKLFAMSMEASNVLGDSISSTILLSEGFFFLRSMLRSLLEREKNATSLPAMIKDKAKSISSVKMKMVDAAGEINKSCP